MCDRHTWIRGCMRRAAGQVGDSLMPLTLLTKPDREAWNIHIHTNTRIHSLLLLYYRKRGRKRVCTVHMRDIKITWTRCLDIKFASPRIAFFTRSLQTLWFPLLGVLFLYINVNVIHVSWYESMHLHRLFDIIMINLKTQTQKRVAFESSACKTAIKICARAKFYPISFSRERWCDSKQSDYSQRR